MDAVSSDTVKRNYSEGRTLVEIDLVPARFNSAQNIIWRDYHCTNTIISIYSYKGSEDTQESKSFSLLTVVGGNQIPKALFVETIKYILPYPMRIMNASVSQPSFSDYEFLIKILENHGKKSYPLTEYALPLSSLPVLAFALFPFNHTYIFTPKASLTSNPKL